MRLVAVTLAISLSSTADNERAMRMLDEWIVMVDRHQVGERDEPLAKLGSWNVDDLTMMRAYVEAFSGVPLDNGQRAARRRQISAADLGRD